jgi:hypothetical protein
MGYFTPEVPMRILGKEMSYLTSEVSMCIVRMDNELLHFISFYTYY